MCACYQKNGKIRADVCLEYVVFYSIGRSYGILIIGLFTYDLNSTLSLSYSYQLYMLSFIYSNNGLK